MIVLDTNVLSELMRTEPSAQVVSWVDAQDTEELATTAVTLGELLYGVARLPDGTRRDVLEQAITDLAEEEFAGRVLAYDAAAAERYADVVAGRERQGRPISAADGQIAAICLATGATLATRNVRDFEDTGVPVIDPWADPPGALA